MKKEPKAQHKGSKVMNFIQSATFWRSTWVHGNHGKTLASKRLDFLLLFHQGKSREH
jgi:hypothetical protein